MNAHSQFLNASAYIDDGATKPFANSRKIYVQGTRADIRVPMRAISLSDTPASFGAEKSSPLYVYDTSGPYTDPDTRIDIRSGLPPLRAVWIEARGDCELLPGLSSQYGRARLSNPKLAELRFNLERQPRRAKHGKTVTQMHYAKAGMVTPEMEFAKTSAARNSPNCCCVSMRANPSVRACRSSSPLSSYATRSLAAARSSPITSTTRKLSR